MRGEAFNGDCPENVLILVEFEKTEEKIPAGFVVQWYQVLSHRLSPHCFIASSRIQEEIKIETQAQAEER